MVQPESRAGTIGAAPGGGRRRRALQPGRLQGVLLGLAAGLHAERADLLEGLGNPRGRGSEGGAPFNGALYIMVHHLMVRYI